MTKTALISIIFLVSSWAWSQNIATPTRIICQTSSPLNTKLIQLRSDAGDMFRPPVVNVLDPQNKPFKEIVSQQIVYSDDSMTIVFIAAVDSQNRFGVYKTEIRNAIKISTSQFINFLSPKLRALANYSLDFSFSLFSLYKGNLLYPSNETGKWRLIALNTGTVLKEWTHPVLVFNPILRDQVITWTTTLSDEGSNLHIYNIKSDTRDIVTFKDKIQVLEINKEEIILVNYYNFDSQKRIFRVQTYNRGSSRMLYEGDSSQSLIGNFVVAGNNLIFTSERAFIVNNQIQVSDASINVLDISKNTITQRIKYPQFLIDLIRKQSPLSIRLLNSPMFNQNEILFSLNEMGGLVKYQFKTANWFYINYPQQENTCYNPSTVSLLTR